jgi:hypothetical protein
MTTPEKQNISAIDRTASKMVLTILVLQHPKATDAELCVMALAQAKMLSPGAEILTPEFDESLAVVRNAVRFLPGLLDEIIPSCGKKLRDCTTTQDRQHAARWLAEAVIAAGPLERDTAVERAITAQRKIN